LRLWIRSRSSATSTTSVSRGELDPVETVRALGSRLVVLEVCDGSGAVLKEIRRLGLKPVMFGVESSPGTVESIDSFNQISMQLGK